MKEKIKIALVLLLGLSLICVTIYSLFIQEPEYYEIKCADGTLLKLDEYNKDWKSLCSNAPILIRSMPVLPSTNWTTS